MSPVRGVARTVQEFLEMSSRPVGIRFEGGPRLAEPSPAPVRFCILERQDLDGGACALKFGDIECPGASLALGLVEPVYRNVEPRVHTPVRTLHVGPVDDADLVLLTVTPRQAMVLALLSEGIEAHCEASHAVCGEVVARVYETGRPHLSLLCPGMRDLCGFRDEELVVGLSLDDFLALPREMARRPALGPGDAQEWKLLDPVTRVTPDAA